MKRVLVFETPEWSIDNSPLVGFCSSSLSARNIYGPNPHWQRNVYKKNDRIISRGKILSVPKWKGRRLARSPLMSETRREGTRERAAKSHSRLLSRAALAWVLATPPNGELAFRLKQPRPFARLKWVNLVPRACSLENGRGGNEVALPNGSSLEDGRALSHVLWGNAIGRQSWITKTYSILFISQVSWYQETDGQWSYVQVPNLIFDVSSTLTGLHNAWPVLDRSLHSILLPGCRGNPWSCRGSSRYFSQHRIRKRPSLT